MAAVLAYKNYSDLASLITALVGGAAGVNCVPEYLVNAKDYNDFDLYSSHGFFSIQSAYSKEHAPKSDVALNHGFLMNFAWEKARSCQVFFCAFQTMGIYMRRFDGTNWSSWETVWEQS